MPGRALRDAPHVERMASCGGNARTEASEAESLSGVAGQRPGRRPIKAQSTANRSGHGAHLQRRAGVFPRDERA